MVKGASKQKTRCVNTCHYLFVHFLISPAATINCKQARPLGIPIDSAMPQPGPFLQNLGKTAALPVLLFLPMTAALLSFMSKVYL